MSGKVSHFYEFDGFRLDAETPGLWRDGRLVQIFPKALEMLVVLVGKHGEIVSRDELLETVWKDTFVEEANITYTVSLLRKSLRTRGNGQFIQTVPKRGYRFVAEVCEVTANGHKHVELNADVARRFNRWNLAAISFVGLFLVTGFSLWWSYEKAAVSTEVSKREVPQQMTNLEARQAYARGRAVYDKKIPGNPEKAIDEYQKAITLDPTFALAYVGIADALSRQARDLPNDRAFEVVNMAKAAAYKALALDPELAEAHASLGLIYRIHERDWANVENNLKRAVELDPKYAYGHLWYAQMLAMVGRNDEAAAEIGLAIEIDPLTPDVKSGRLAILETRGEYAKGLRLARELADFDKERPLARRGLAVFLYHTGDDRSVIDICEQDLPRYDKQKWVWLSLAAASHHRTGQGDKRDEALYQLERLSENDSQALYSLAQNYAEMGRLDESADALEKCFQMREERLQWVRAEPRFANLRADPRFLGLLRKMNLPGYD